MPKKYRSKKTKSLSLNTTDISINDYANVPKNQCGRVKKCAGESLLQKSNAEMEPEELPWYEKNFDDEEDKYQYVQAKKTTQRKKKTASLSDDDECHLKYPFDLWMIIAQYIPPEIVGKFALICKDTWEVTRTVTFWKNLYNRYYKRQPPSVRSKALPDRLQPISMRCLQGLRPCVIRSLFYTYAPFVERVQIKLISPFSGDILQKHSLLYFWIRKDKDYWSFYFKFRSTNSLDSRCENKMNVKLHKLEADIFANSEQHCYMLVAKCRQFTPLPPVITSTVILSASLMQKVASNMLRLIFDTRGYLSRQQVVSSETIIIDINGVQTVHVYPWWHPSYPIDAMYAPIPYRNCEE